MSRDRGMYVELGKQLLDGHCAQLSSRHTVAVGQQPGYIQRLAAQWHEDTAAFFERQLIKILHEQRIGFAPVEPYLVACPPVVPKLCIHNSDLSKSLTEHFPQSGDPNYFAAGSIAFYLTWRKAQRLHFIRA